MAGCYGERLSGGTEISKGRGREQETKSVSKSTSKLGVGTEGNCAHEVHI